MHYTKKIARSLAATGLAIVLTVGTAFASVGTATVTADALRLRSEANTGSRTLALVYKGSTVELLSGEENGWYTSSLTSVSISSSIFLRHASSFADPTA